MLYDGGKHAEEVPELLGTTENELGIRKWLEDQGHTLVTTSDKDREGSKFDQELVDAEVIITTPYVPFSMPLRACFSSAFCLISIHCRFHPGYLTAERLAKAKKLKLAVTAGIGSDHVDLNAANKTNGGITVAEVTGSNVVSVAEHVIMTILTLVRNFVPAHEQIQAGEWDVAAAAKNEFDLEGKVVGTVAVGRIGERVLRRLKPFDCKELLYFDYQPLKPEIEKEIGCRRVESLEEMLSQCDVVTINCPLHEKTKGLFNKELISKMKKGIYSLPVGYALSDSSRCANISRLMARQYRSWRHRRKRGCRRRPSLGPPSWLRRRCLVSPTGAQRPSTPLRQESLRRRERHGPSHVRYQPGRSEALRRGHQEHPRQLLFGTGRLPTRGSDRAQGRLRDQGVRSESRWATGEQGGRASVNPYVLAGKDRDVEVTNVKSNGCELSKFRKVHMGACMYVHMVFFSL